MPSPVLLTSVQMGLYDSTTGFRVTPEKALDMSDTSPLGETWMVAYAHVQRGQLVKVILYRGPQSDPQSTVETHWFVSELDRELQASDSTLPRFAQGLGFSSEGLVAILQKYAPPVTTTER